MKFSIIYDKIIEIMMIMLIRILIIHLLLFNAFILTAGADYYPDEKPVYGLSQNTAFLLKRGKISLNMWGWISYGLWDNIQIGTNLALFPLSVTNANTKIKIIEENQVFPQIALGLSYYDTTKYHTNYWDSALYLSKSLVENSSWIYGGMKNYHVAHDDSKESFSNTNYSLGMILTHDNNLRSFYEVSQDYFLTGSHSSFYGAGLEWAWELYRIKLGLGNVGGKFIPIFICSLKSLPR